jgi:hypothetical protein
MSEYTDDLLKSSGIPGKARTPGTDGLFEVRDTALPVPEDVRVWFHKHVAMTLYLAKRARPELLTAVSFLATRVTKCDSDDVDKLIRLIRYISASREMGMILKPGASGIRVCRCVVRGACGRTFSCRPYRTDTVRSPYVTAVFVQL